MEEYYKKVKSAMLAIGFSDEEADRQLTDLANIVRYSILEKILTENPDSKNEIEMDLDGFMKKRYGDETSGLVGKITAKMTTEYLEKVTEGLPEEKVKAFFDHINS